MNTEYPIVASTYIMSAGNLTAFSPTPPQILIFLKP